MLRVSVHRFKGDSAAFLLTGRKAIRLRFYRSLCDFKSRDFYCDFKSLRLQFCASDCDCNPHIQESPHPRAPKIPKKSKKVFPGLPVRSVKKVSKKFPNTDFDTLLTLFQVFWDFFDTFWTLRAGRAGKTFLRLFFGHEKNQ